MTAPLPSRTPAAAITLLRRHVATVERLAADPATDPCEAAELREVAARIRHYEQGAPYGVTLDRAIGLKPQGPADRNWWTSETISAQRAAVERYCREHCAGLSSGAAAKLIHRDVHRLARSHGGAPSGTAATLADAATLPRAIPKSPRSIRGILAAAAGETPPIAAAKNAPQIAPIEARLVPAEDTRNK